MTTPTTSHFRLAQEMRKAVYMLGYAATNMENGHVDAEHRRTMADQLVELAKQLERGPVLVAEVNVDRGEVQR